METSSRPRSGVLHNISFKWLEGAYQELHDQLEAQGELRYLDAVLHFVEGTAVNVGIRLGSQFVAISSAVFGIRYSQYSQYHFSISKAKPTSSICTENIKKDFSIPNTALAIRFASLRIS
jgi:hypothetical protein